LERFLKETFGLTPPLHYRKLYGGLGLSFGILFGVIFLSSFERSIGIVFGMLIGMVIGSLIGISTDKKAIEEGRVI
jgi:xanthine/uracil permease